MPGLYRSKSVRRLDDFNQLTQYIEKDNRKVLGAASVQLFLSVPQLEKWFKSSTGTLCFHKDFTNENRYYFRLYSLMQGLLWEQEIHAPFSYRKLSFVFHYLTYDRFYFGFKFICDDEAERFYNVIKKFSSANTYSNVNKTTNANKENLESTEILSMATMNATPYFTRNSRKLGSTPALHTTSSLSSINTSSSSTVKPTTPATVQTTINTTNVTVKPRTAVSIDRKRKIEKSEISCPFRCSCDDLHLASEQTADTSLIKSIQQKFSSMINTPISAQASKQMSSSSSFSKASTSTPSTIVSRSDSRNVEIKQCQKDEELEITKELLIKFNLPINKKFIQVLRNCMKPYGDVNTFKESIKTEAGEKRLNAFIAATCAASIATTKSNYQYQQNIHKNMASSVPNIVTSPTPPTSPIMSPICSKTTSVSTVTSVHQATATSTMTATTCLPQNESTPIQQRAKAILTKFVSSEQQIHQQHFSKLSRSQTPSPSPSRSRYQQQQQQHEQKPTPPTRSSNKYTVNAPPKPPRRPSLKASD